METKIKKEIILFLVLSLSLINLVYAIPSFGSIPPIPDHFYGNVLIDGQNASIGTQISIYVNSVLESIYNVTEQGRYDLYVKSGNAGDVVEFKILDKSAGSSTRQGGETINLNLSISTTTPPSPPSGGGSGGSSGGGSSGGSGGGSSGGGSSGRVTYSTPQQEANNNITPSEEEEKETEKIEGKSPLTSLTVLDFVKSGKGIGIIIASLIIISGIGVMLIKFKPLKRWTKKFSV